MKVVMIKMIMIINIDIGNDNADDYYTKYDNERSMKIILTIRRRRRGRKKKTKKKKRKETTKRIKKNNEETKEARTFQEEHNHKANTVQ